MSNKPTTRQIQGHLNALRATRSHISYSAIDIASGNYGQGKVFSGAVGISDPTWSGATATFYVYLDQFDSLVLDDTNSFPVLCTKIARVEISSGIIINVIDERAEVNGLLDAYQIGFDDSGMQVVSPADSVQEAIEILDAYVASNIAPTQKSISLDVGDGIKNGLVRFSHLDDAPAIEFTKRISGIGRVRYSIEVPKDWVQETDIIIRVYWSPQNADAGNVKWRLSYKLIESGANIDNSMTTVSVTQAAPEVLNRLVDTGNDLRIIASNIQSNKIFILNIERECSLDDTYSYTARMHYVRMEYIGK